MITKLISCLFVCLFLLALGIFLIKCVENIEKEKPILYSMASIFGLLFCIIGFFGSGVLSIFVFQVILS